MPRKARRRTPVAAPPRPAIDGPSPDALPRLSRSFTLRELLQSQTAERQPALKAAQENPPQAVLDSLRYLAATTLQPLRDRIGAPLFISSGYRCPEVNRLVGGSATSQHMLGEAADCHLVSGFGTADAFAAIRETIRALVRDRVGRPLRGDVGDDFYLFAYVCGHLDELDVDQLIHEYGAAPGLPAWVHLSASVRRTRGHILSVGSYTGREYRRLTVEQALEMGT
jgi:zinc D-Ala-D-Ala carboxypeptidase